MKLKSVNLSPECKDSANQGTCRVERVRQHKTDETRIDPSRNQGHQSQHGSDKDDCCADEFETDSQPTIHRYTKLPSASRR